MKGKRKEAGLWFFTSRLTTVVSIALALSLSGVVALTLLLGQELSSFVKEQLTFSIILEDTYSADEVVKLEEQLIFRRYIKSTRYISKEQALRELIEELGDNPETFLGYNPLRASIEVNLHADYMHPDSLAGIEKDIKGLSTVSDLLYRRDMMETVHANISRVGLLLSGLALALLIISFVLVNNTIRLLIYSKRFLIHTMKLVGATGGFIRGPFLRYNIVSGLMAGLLALCLLGGGYYYIGNQWEEFGTIVELWMVAATGAGVVIVGMALSAVATLFAVNRYLRMSIDKMFYM
jgi:cell division transport system permease protein